MVLLATAKEHFGGDPAFPALINNLGVPGDMQKTSSVVQYPVFFVHIWPRPRNDCLLTPHHACPFSHFFIWPQYLCQDAWTALSFRRRSLTFIKALPNKFRPHSPSLPSASSPLNPMPQFLSAGLASARIRCPESSSACRHSSIWLHLR